MTDPPKEINGVIKADVTNQAFRGDLIVQAMWATDSAIVSDYAGNEVWEATGEGQGVRFESGVELRGFKVASGFGDVYVYLKMS